MIMKAWLPVSRGEKTSRVYPRVSSGSGRAMAALGTKEGPTKDEEGLMPRRQWWMVGGRWAA